MHDRLISLSIEVWVHKTSLTPPLFIEVPVPIQESERSCICVRSIDLGSVSTIFLIDFGTIPTFVFHFISKFFLLQSFAVEELFTDRSEVRESSIRIKVEKAGGANYGTGVRG